MNDLERTIEELARRVEALEEENKRLRHSLAPSDLRGGGRGFSRRHLLTGGVGVLGALAGAGLVTHNQSAFAAPPTVVNYQGRLTDSSGNPVNGTVPMIFALYPAATLGSAFWTESRTGGNAVPVQNGLFNVYLGSIQPLDPSQLSGPVYLGISVNGDPEMTPREQLGSVPFALSSAGAITNNQFTTPKMLGLQINLPVQSGGGNYWAQYTWNFNNHFNGPQFPSIVASAYDNYTGAAPGTSCTCQVIPDGYPGAYAATIQVSNVNGLATQVGLSALAFGQ